MTNHEQILDVLRRANGNWVCTTVFDTMFIRDHRKRVSELIELGHKIESEPCRGICGKIHNSNIYKRRLISYSPTQTSQNAPGATKTPKTDSAANQFLADWGPNGKLRQERDECITSPTLF